MDKIEEMNKLKIKLKMYDLILKSNYKTQFKKTKRIKQNYLNN